MILLKSLLHLCGELLIQLYYAKLLLILTCSHLPLNAKANDFFSKNSTYPYYINVWVPMMADLKNDWYFNLLSEMVTCAQDSSNVNFQSKATYITAQQPC